MARFNLTQLQIILYLKDIEQKLPYKEYSEFQLPTYHGGTIPIDGINIEAKRMFDFVGLTAFTPKCEWANLPNGVGGNIDLNDARFGDVTIRISSRYTKNGYATLAVLAHEICHKVLHYYDLYFHNFDDLNEIYTDLCTMYIGFSQLILNGYKTLKGDGIYHFLGYLDIDNYSQTERIVRLFRDKSYQININSNAGVLTEYEQDIQDWLNTPNKRDEHKQGFAEKSRQTSELFKNIALLKQLLSKIPEQFEDYLLKLDKNYFINDPFVAEGDFYTTQHPISAYVLARPLLYLDNSVEPNQAAELNSMVVSAIDRLSSLENVKTDSCKTFRFFCPFCGNEQEDITKKGKKIIVRCPKCKRRFLLDCLDYKPGKRDADIADNKKRSFWKKLLNWEWTK